MTMSERSEKRAWTFRPPHERFRRVCSGCARAFWTAYPIGGEAPPPMLCPYDGQAMIPLEDDDDGEE